MKTYIIDDSSIYYNSWVKQLDSKACYVVLYTSDEVQHMTDEDKMTLMAKGIKSQFIRCFTLEDLYMQIGFQIGRVSAIGEDVIIVSDSKEYDNFIGEWQRSGLNVTREFS